MLVRGVVHDQVNDDADAALFGRVGELHKIPECAVARINFVIVGNVVAVVAARGGLERHEPYRRHTQPLQIIQTAHEAGEVADAIAARVHISGH
jgi:hypothetical protein